MTTTEEVRMTIKTLAGRQVPNREIARQLDMTEGNVRYHLRRMATGAVDGRTRQRHRAADLAEAIALYRTGREDGPVNLAALHDWLVAEHGYPGSLRSVQRYFREHYPPPRQAGPAPGRDAARGPGPGGLGEFPAWSIAGR